MTCPVYATIKAHRAEYGDDFIRTEKTDGGMCWLEDAMTGRGLRLFTSYDAAAKYRSNKRALAGRNTA